MSRLLLALGLLLPTSGRSVVILGDAKFSSWVIAPDPADQHLVLEKTLQQGDGACGFFFRSVYDENSGTASTRITGSFIAELYELFIVAPGVTFDAAYVATHEPVASNSGATPPFLLPYVEGQSSLFAYWDDRSARGGGGVVNEADAVDLYGWVAIDYTLDEDPVTFVPAVSWSVRDGATATGLGIVTGTYNQIPEPAASAALAAFAVLGAQILRRQRRFG